jgi:hypothetical protein
MDEPAAGPDSVPIPVPVPATESPVCDAVSSASSVQCPSCNATLKKVTIAPGVKINCLHCGIRFFPAGTGTYADAATTAGEFRPVLREPKSPGYWLLRVPATIACAAGLFITALIAWNEFPSRNSSVLEFCTAGSYVPLIGLAGLLAFFWTRSLARIDAGMTSLLWRLGILREPLPAMEGSSLPYIAPLSIAGGMFPIMMFSLNEGRNEAIVVAAAYGAVLFLAGFMAEDLRQFASRERALAEKISPPTLPETRMPYDNNIYPWTGLLLAGSFGCFALSFAIMCGYLWRDRAMSYNKDFVAIWICMGLFCGAISVTAFMLGVLWDHNVSSWVRTAARCENQSGKIISGSEAPYFRSVAVLAAIPLFWGGYGILWVLCTALNSPFEFREAPFTFLCFFIGVFCLALWLPRMLIQTTRWRSAKRRVCSSLMKEGPNEMQTSFANWPESVVAATFVLAILEAVLMALLMTGQIRSWRNNWELITSIPLILGCLHYPTLWVAAICREFFWAEKCVTRTASHDES